MRKTVVRLVAEFWLPFVLAVAWTTYEAYSGPTHRTATAIVPTFSASFFLLSWLTGQVVRVRRQANLENSLTGVAGRLDNLVTSLDASSEKLINTFTGGNAFAFLQLSPLVDDSNRFHPVILHEGSFPLSHLHVRITDLETFQSDMAAGNPFGSDIHLDVEELIPDNVSFHEDVILTPEGERQDYNAFFNARNGHWTQLFRMRRVAGKWLQASIVLKDEAEIYRKIPEGFPATVDKEFDRYISSDAGQSLSMK